MKTSPQKLKLLLDEGVPASVGTVFEKSGHQVLPFSAVVARGSADEVVSRAALLNDAVLVALDGDMKAIAKRGGVGRNRFSKLNLIKLSCDPTQAAARLTFAMSLIEHEWSVSDKKAARRLFVEIGGGYIRTNR